MRCLSIIIPIYNVEKYIYGTLASIYGQKCDESTFEVVVVNDGTPDNSMEIVDSFLKKYSNLTVINQKNQGLSCARNAGLKIASGEYIWFVDSDDQIAPKSINLVIESISSNNAEISGFNVIKHKENTNEETTERPMTKKVLEYGRLYSGKQASKWMQYGMVQRFVFQKKFLTDHNLSFLPNIYQEDDEFMVKAIVYAKKILFVNEVSYLYLVRSNGSIMSNVKKKYLEDVIAIIDSWKKFLGTNGTDKWICQYVFANILVHMCWCVDAGKKSHDEDVIKFCIDQRNQWKTEMLKSFFNSGMFLSFSKIKSFFKNYIRLFFLKCNTECCRKSCKNHSL